MFELRWLEKIEPISGNLARTVRVLQYRAIERDYELGGTRYQEFGEWQDVPVVTDSTRTKD